MRISELRDLVVRSGLARPEEVKPCSEDEVRALEVSLGIELPNSYRNFLLAMGRSAGSLFIGSSAFYESLFELREWAQELLEENEVRDPLPPDAFVFLMHQGYQFMFLRNSEGEDPPVRSYNEADPGQTFQVIAPSFTQFLADAIEGHARAQGH